MTKSYQSYTLFADKGSTGGEMFQTKLFRRLFSWKGIKSGCVSFRIVFETEQIEREKISSSDVIQQLPRCVSSIKIGY